MRTNGAAGSVGTARHPARASEFARMRNEMRSVGLLAAGCIDKPSANLLYM